MSKMRPFLKWAGGKYRSVERIKTVLPPGGCLVEPFLGSGAVFLNTDYDENILADNNADLINLYQVLQAEGESFISYCRTFFTPFYNNEDQYYGLREVFNNNPGQSLKAALFLYLNRHSFNGLCRYNSKGKFNTPFGRHEQPYFPLDEMRYFHKKAKNAVFKVADFRETMREAKPSSCVYCDPPYIPLSETANFTRYSAGGFNIKDQLDLAMLAKELTSRGIAVLISNHATKFTLEAYKGAKIEHFNVQRNISCNGNNRGKAAELLALFQ
jgi:DNA adenine methylase